MHLDDNSFFQVISFVVIHNKDRIMFISSNLGVEGLVDGVLRLGLHLSPGLAVDVVGVELGHVGGQVAPVK